jgi:hypothetical protein
VAIGDLDRDGKADLAVANSNSNDVSVLLGVGDGTFGTASNHGAHTNPDSVVVGDLNGDAKPDLAVSNLNSSDVSVLLQTSGKAFTAHFSPVSNYGANSGPRSIAVGDLNGDGSPDLAVANVGFAVTTVSVLLGAGDGTFGAASTFGAHSQPESVAIGDLNRDGAPDLAVANFTSNDVSVLLGVGDGTFATKVDYGAHTHPLGIAIGDLNRDGTLDLAVANQDSADVSVLLGVGNGTFGSAVNYGAHTQPQSVAIGDLNRDGKPDLAVPNYGTSDVSVLLGAGDGTFGTATNFGAHTNPESVAIGDLNRDGKPDMAAGNINSGDVSILLGVGDGTFETAVNYAAHESPSSVSIGDINGDGKLDLAVTNSSSDDVSALLGKGDGTFGTAVNHVAHTHPSSVAIGDLNGDGKPDLAVANADSNDISVLLQDSTPPNTTITGHPHKITNHRSARFTFTSTEAGSSFQCKRDSGSFSSCTSPKTYTGLADGSHTFRVKAIDPAGNPDPTPAKFTWKIDTKPPQTTITAGPSGATHDRTPTFRFTSSEAGSFTCSVDGKPYKSCTSPDTLPRLGFGKHVFRVRARDRAGNTDPTPASRSFTVVH